ncbi:uncharacterized protein HMF8227_01418 [Saliniradius amylolyticus]|uniref:Outer membrane lipoprotein-sorting protein n=1 Tax=Saliniradius amylolyticus TaxID=2183582 RepID=A0A2S2E2N5_9ALTE|nr:DUF1329 domain-containing protein [Saliniradius amylolyticus]AWL11893.1 uncharacterized protein HMF8227_01418 [Saliniradius amylolyticus]
MRKLALVAAALGLALSAHGTYAKVSEAEAAKLGNELTPLGGKKAGNEDGSIPAWTGGITEPPAGYEVGDHHPNPFPEDKVQFTITAENMSQYADYLSAGQKAMFKAYPDSFKMPVYQTRRTAANPEFVYEATKANATRAELAQGGNGVKNAAIGVPFPIPQNGLEVIWNHILRYRGQAIQRYGGQAGPTPSGDYNLVGFDDILLVNYADKDATPAELTEENIIMKFKQQVTEPARLAGTALLVHETMDQVKEPRRAWTYNTGQRRVRKAPNVAYDAPGTASDGLRTSDDFDMYNGAPDRYNWKLVGKQEMYVPYNNYRLHSDELSYDQVLQPGHINPDLTRYEKHRVWVVEANLKDEFRHIYKKRVFYIDEDSWQILVTDMYDNRDELYRNAMAYAINYYEVPTLWSTLDVYHDLNSRRYLALGLDNEAQMYDFTVEPSEREFTPQALRRSGIR